MMSYIILMSNFQLGVKRTTSKVEQDSNWKYSTDVITAELPCVDPPPKVGLYVYMYVIVYMHAINTDK